MGFPLDGGSIEDGILTCHWHHARFELRSGCTFDLWADDVPTCPVEIRAGGEIWVKPVFGYVDPAGHWHQRLADGLDHNLSLVIAKAVHGQLAADQSPSISSTRPSSVSTSSAGTTPPMCCRAWSARWRQLGVLRNGQRGASPPTSSLWVASA